MIFSLASSSVREVNRALHAFPCIVVAAVRQSWNGAMKVYDEWCTGAFDIDARDGWPVPPNELFALATEMQAVTRFEALAKAP